jgi:hypothetical protein
MSDAWCSESSSSGAGFLRGELMRWFVRIVVIFVALCPLVREAAAGDRRHLEDATLRSVFFIDTQEGWVVGDAGVILHTLNGGKTWEQQ